jgi:hypothetical protein
LERRKRMCELCRELEKLGLKVSVVTPDPAHPVEPTTVEAKDAEGKPVALDPTDQRQMLEFAWNWIKKLSPESAILIEKLSESLGTDVLQSVKPDPKFLTTQDLIGAMILAKTITHVVKSDGVMMQMYTLSARLAGLPQMAGVNPPKEPMPHGKFSSVQLLDSVPKAN